MYGDKKQTGKLLGIVAIIFFLAASSAYFYRLHLNFWPDPEYGEHTLRFFYRDQFGGTFKLVNKNIISYFISYLCYKIFGVGFQGVRVVAAFKYLLVLTFCTLLSVYSVKERKVKWYLLPLLAFLVVVISPGLGSYCGTFRTDTFTYVQYPYDMHMEALFFALLECFLLEVSIHLTSKKKQILAASAIFIICIVGIKTTDLYFGIGFYVPLFFCLLAYLWKKHRELFCDLLMLFFGALALLRIVSIVFAPLQSFFGIKSLGYGEWAVGNAVYGDSGFADFGNIFPSISNTLASLLALFNVELSGTSILSIYTLTAGIKICLIVVIYVTAVRTVIDSVRDNGKKQDLLSIVCSYTVILTTLFVMFSSYGAREQAPRMLVIIIYYGAILLCRNVEGIILFLLPYYKSTKRFLGLLFCFCVIISIFPAKREVFQYEKYKQDFRNLAELVKENELGIGISNVWSAVPLTEVSEGECVVLTGKFIDGKLSPCCSGVHINYFITESSTAFDIDSMYELFGNPDEVYEYETWTIYYYKEGIDV